MKAILEFTLPEEDYEHGVACAALDTRAALGEFRQYLRNVLKYDSENMDPTTVVAIQAKFYELCGDTLEP